MECFGIFFCSVYLAFFVVIYKVLSCSTCVHLIRHLLQKLFPWHQFISTFAVVRSEQILASRILYTLYNNFDIFSKPTGSEWMLLGDINKKFNIHFRLGKLMHSHLVIFMFLSFHRDFRTLFLTFLSRMIIDQSSKCCMNNVRWTSNFFRPELTQINHLFGEQIKLQTVFIHCNWW